MAAGLMIAAAGAQRQITVPVALRCCLGARSAAGLLLWALRATAAASPGFSGAVTGAGRKRLAKENLA